jgi:hypothetical protein
VSYEWDSETAWEAEIDRRIDLRMEEAYEHKLALQEAAERLLGKAEARRQN